MQLKQRLVGLAVLIALAVVFIPMLLRGPDDIDAIPDGLKVPANPGHVFTSRIDPEPAVRQAIPETPEQSVIDAPAPAGAVMPETGEAVNSADAASPVTSQAQMKPIEISAPAPPSDNGWVVQVGSFSQEANALSLRDGLRAKGYAVFVERLAGTQGAAWRVRVGPEVDRGRADTLRDRLEREQGIKGALVQAYP